MYIFTSQQQANSHRSQVRSLPSNGSEWTPQSVSSRHACPPSDESINVRPAKQRRLSISTQAQRRGGRPYPHGQQMDSTDSGLFGSQTRILPSQSHPHSNSEALLGRLDSLRHNIKDERSAWQLGMLSDACSPVAPALSTSTPSLVQDLPFLLTHQIVCLASVVPDQLPDQIREMPNIWLTLDLLTCGLGSMGGMDRWLEHAKLFADFPAPVALLNDFPGYQDAMKASVHFLHLVSTQMLDFERTCLRIKHVPSPQDIQNKFQTKSKNLQALLVFHMQRRLAGRPEDSNWADSRYETSHGRASETLATPHPLGQQIFKPVPHMERPAHSRPALSTTQSPERLQTRAGQSSLKNSSSQSVLVRTTALPPNTEQTGYQAHALWPGPHRTSSPSNPGHRSVPAEETQKGMPSERGRAYQYVSELALQPQEITQKSVLCKWTFNMSAENMARLARDVKRDMNGHTKGPMDSRPVIYRLRCEKGRLSGVSDPSTWAITDCTWPPYVYYSMNGRHLQIRRKVARGPDLPCDVTPMLVEGENVVEAVANMDHNGPTVFFALGVEVVRLALHSAIMRDVSDRKFTVDQTKAALVKSIHCARSNENEVVFPNTKVKLSVSNLGLKTSDIPVRGPSCRHLQCLGLDSLLRNRVLTSPGDRYRVDVWRCPLCGGDVRPNVLMVDELMQLICGTLAEAGIVGTRFVALNVDGSWKDLGTTLHPTAHAGQGGNGENG